jgi:hypothetical protein
VPSAAVRADAAAIFAFNVSDFPASSVGAFEIEIIEPDTFLLDQLDLVFAAVTDELTRQAAANRHQPKTLASLLDALPEQPPHRSPDELRRRTT